MQSPFARVLRIAVLCVAAPALAHGQGNAPTVLEVATALGFDSAAVARAQKGEIVSRAIDESSRNEIGAVVAMVLRAPVSRVEARIRKAGAMELDPSVLAHGPIQVPATAASLAALQIPPAELDRLAQASAGSDLNLSTDEIAALRAAAPKGRDAVGAAFRGLLAARVEAYRKSGLAGIAPYARARGASTSPADALRSALDASVGFAKFAPATHAALASYPRGVPRGTDDRFFWAVIDVQGRPAVVLVHRLVGRAGDVVEVSERQFFASQGFNAIQVLFGLFPVENNSRTAVIYSNRTNSDQAARFGRMAQSVGRRVLVGEVTRFFAAAQKEAGG
jgi:hypothetical protein